MDEEYREIVAQCDADRQSKGGSNGAGAKRPKGDMIKSGTSGGVAYPPCSKARSDAGSGRWDDAGPADRAAGASSPTLASEA
eukprot:1012327-Lingulodinium_polyedra.AAC.1